MGKECIFNHIGEKRGVVDQIRTLDISVPGQVGTELESSGLGRDNIRYWPQLFGTY